MRSILVLVKKDLAHFLRDRPSLLLTFLVPFALIALFGFIFGLYGGKSGPSGIPLGIVDESHTRGSAALVAALKAEPSFQVVLDRAGPHQTRVPLQESDLAAAIRADHFHFAVVLPPDLTSGEHFGLHVKLVEDPQSSIETQMVTGLLQKTIFTSVPRLIGSHLQDIARRHIGSAPLEAFDHRIADAVASSFGGNADEIYRHISSGDMGGPAAADGAGAAGGNLLASIVSIDTVQVAGQDVSKPYATQMIGGWAVQFLLFALTASAVSLFHERDNGIFQRLLSGTCSRSAVLYSKFIYGMLVGLLQLLVLFFAGHLLFGIVLGPYLPKLVLVSLCAAATCSAFGMLLASLANSQETARGLSTFAILTMSAIGGAWMPISMYPAIVQKVSRLTPVYWSLEGFVRVLWAHASFAELMPVVGILVGMAAVILAVACWRFNRGSVFG
ncbi:MAG TPA: ABC transporter permease [Opitutaceae bacterium]|jgi:ABC-2 type transport system permease protein